MYDSFSIDYDRFVNWPSRLAYELPFIEKTMEINSEPGNHYSILDAACGTGWHAIALGEKGYAASGADLSPGMVERARLNNQNKQTKVNFKVAGFNELAKSYSRESEFPFNAVLCLGNSLPHLLSYPALVQALEEFNACLKPGGLIMIQNRNFDGVMADRQRWMEPQSTVDGQTEWLFIRFYDFTSNGLIDFNIMSLRRENEGPWKQALHTTQLRPILAAEMSTALASTGYNDIVFYGDMTGSSFDPARSGNLVVTARKSSTAVLKTPGF